MLQLNDRVYHKGVDANGYIAEIDNRKQNPYRVIFFWAHYCQILHTPPRPMVKNPYGPLGYGSEENRKWQWCSEDSLIPMDINFFGHRIALVNKRIGDKRLHLVGEIPYADEGPADIYIRYGGNLNHNGGKLTINERIVMDKFDQMNILGEELALRSIMYKPDDGAKWILKPRRSCGGENVRYAEGSHIRPGKDYYQEFFPKVREFRAHTFLWNDNPVPFIQEKAMKDPEQLCWNKKQGGNFRYIYQDGLDHGDRMGALDDASRLRMSAMAVETLKRLHYDYGGIDFGMDNTGAFKVFEVNSAMGIRERSLFTYKTVMNKLRQLDINHYKQTRWEL